MAKLVTIDDNLIKMSKDGQLRIDIYDLVDCINGSLGDDSITDKDVANAMTRYIAEIQDTVTLAKFAMMVLKALEHDIKYEDDLDPVYIAAFRAGKQVVKYLTE